MAKPNKKEALNSKFRPSLLIWLIVATLAVGIGIKYLKPSVTGLATGEYSYTDNINLALASSLNYTWQPSNAGILKSLKLNGRISTTGSAKAYLESNGQKYLIFDSSKLNQTSSNLITGFVVDEQPGKGNDKGNAKANKKPEWASSTEKFTINGTTTINLSQYFSDEDGDSLTFSSSQPDGAAISISNELAALTPTSTTDLESSVTFTASDGKDSKDKKIGLLVIAPIAAPIEDNATNETANGTMEINKSITINLAYKSGSAYDDNDDGIETTSGSVDLSVEGTTFNWDADQSKLCTKYELYNIDEGTLTKFCNGNADCCAFVSLVPTKSNWSAIYYSVYGKDGAGYNNAVSAQAIYYDVNLIAGSAKSDIAYSQYANKSVKFTEEQLQFGSQCVETCLLLSLNGTSYNLVFEIDGASLTVDSIDYLIEAQNITNVTANSPPVFLQNISSINITKNKKGTINLSLHFSDEDGDSLNYGYYFAENITIAFNGSIAAIIPDNNFEGIRFTFITANDSKSSATSNVFAVNVAASSSSLPSVNTSLGSFEIRDKSDKLLAVIDSLGNMNIKGVLQQNSEPSADSDDFSIQDANGGLNAAIINPEGNLVIKGTLNENVGDLIPTANSFIIQDRDGINVAYFSSTGSLFLKGTMTENVVFE